MWDHHHQQEKGTVTVVVPGVDVNPEHTQLPDLWAVLTLNAPRLSLQFEEMNSELEENRELADNRNSELQKLEQDLASVNHENNNMKVQRAHSTHLGL